MRAESDAAAQDLKNGLVSGKQEAVKDPIKLGRREMGKTQSWYPPKSKAMLENCW
jgi:hypothetical protein